MRRLAELAIVGAGPAGARAAELLAARGIDVALLDPKAPWEKPCGGGLTSTLFDEVPELAQLQPLARPVRVARVELATGAGFEVELMRPIWIVSREDLGRWQLERALRAGAEHLPVRVRSIARTVGGWRLDTNIGSLEAGALVGADGAASIVRRFTGCGLRLHPMATRVEYPRLDGGPADVLVLRFFPGVMGYLWDFPRRDHRSVGMEVPTGVATRDLVDAALDTYLGDDGSVGTPDRERKGAIIGTAPLRPGRFACMAGARFALVGDAAGLADPFTGEGIRNAFRSAGLLAEVFAPGDDRWPHTYARSARREFARDLAVASLLRRALAGTRVGITLVEHAGASDRAYAFVAATLDALALHDYGVGAFVRRWLTRYRRGGRLPSPGAAGVQEQLATLGDRA
ncbi:MAG: NAD(P)/FAD-dependent oxidoreductase [Gemmatimonadetes bacterium]|nr:NAD(P)/FAD-dependent oxidoreductase [Gemmatimonadota bacterium]